MKKTNSRREFIKAGLLAAGGTAAAFLGAVHSSSDTSAAPASGTPYYFPIVDHILPTATPRPTLPPAGAYTFIDGPSGNVNTRQDMQMSLGWPTDNGGAHEEFQFEVNQRCLLRFNLSLIPASATCRKATLYLYRNRSAESDPVANLSIYSIASGNARWNPGNKDIDPASAGESCWNAQASDGRGGVAIPWAGSAGCSTPGSDFENTPMATFVFDPRRPLGAEYAIPLSTSRVEGWFGTSNTNYGIIIFSDKNSGHVAQSDHSVAGLHPKLVVEYEVA